VEAGAAGLLSLCRGYRPLVGADGSIAGSSPFDSSPSPAAGHAIAAPGRPRRAWFPAGLLAVALVAGALLAATRLRTRGMTPVAGHAGFMDKAIGAEIRGCSTEGENCWDTVCCVDPGHTCFAKDLGWATCKPSCTPGIDHTEPKSYQTAWLCTRVTKRQPRLPRPSQALPPPSQIPAPPGACSAAGSNCITSKCCKDLSLTCYEKDPAWATCMRSCTPGVNMSKPKELQSPWSCAVPNRCSAEGDNCLFSRCCRDPSMKCYEKNPGWYGCRRSCAPGQVDASEPSGSRTRWSCKVADACAATGDSCLESRCCRSPGDRCFVKNRYFAACKKSCDVGVHGDDPKEFQTPWSCEVAAKRPTDTSAPVPEPAAPVPTCSNEDEDCLETKCCSDPGMTCFAKHANWAVCRRGCTPGINSSEPLEAQTPWSCERVAATTTTTAPPPTQKPGQSLYCFSLMQARGYEVGLIRSQLERGASIFSCDGYGVYSNETVVLSAGPPAKIVTDSLGGSLICEIGGRFHTALNSEVFVRVWKKVFDRGVFWKHDWTVKVDPDAVFLPKILRIHVARYLKLEGYTSSAKVYLNNCKDGLHGPIEVISRGGMAAFSDGISDCHQNLKWEFSTYGEDVFLRHCLARLGVKKSDDFGLLMETVCDPFPQSPSPCVTGKVSFHPLKSPDKYFKCLGEAEKVAATE